MSDTSGRLFEMPYATWDPDSSCWRTYAGTSHSGSRRFSGTWPTSGSMRDGACFEHPTWAHPTSAPAFSLLLGTPTSHPRTHEPRDVDHGIALANQVALLPTPRSNEANGTGDHGTGGPDLRTSISLLPTPRAQNGEPRNHKPYHRWNEDGTLRPNNLECAVAKVIDPTLSLLPGGRTDPPSNDGKPSTDPHQPQLPTEG